MAIETNTYINQKDIKKKIQNSIDAAFAINAIYIKRKTFFLQEFLYFQRFRLNLMAEISFLSNGDGKTEKGTKIQTKMIDYNLSTSLAIASYPSKEK